MQIFFLLTVVLAGSYFLLARRRFDLFSVAYFSACVYFLPGFFGYALRPLPVDGWDRAPLPLIPETYAVFVLVLAAILAGAVLLDGLQRLPGGEAPSSLRLPPGATPARVALALALAGAVLTALHVGTKILSPVKTEFMADLGRSYELWVVAASVAAVLAFAERRWWILAVAAALLLADLYIGFRSSLATTMIAFFLLWLGGRGRQRLITSGGRTAVFAVLAVGLMFVYKFFFKTIKGQYWWQLSERISDPSYLLKSFTESEPFTTQAILNEVLAHDFHIPFETLGQVFYQLIFLAPSLGARPKAFFEYFQPALFPEAKSGMAGNIWAQMWSTGGWPLLLLFVGIFVLGLAAGSWWLARFEDSKLRSGIALLGSYWAFYIHRNDLSYAINLEKRVLVVWAACAVAGLGVAWWHERRRRRLACAA